MNPSAPAARPSDSVDPAFADLVEQLTARIQAGEPVDVDACLREHPEHAGPLKELLPALRLLADLSRPGPRGLSGIMGPGGEEAAASGTLGDFRIVREVGRGGMGMVYEAEQISLGRRVALKVLPFAAAMDPRQLQRFKNEAQAAAHLQHTNIVPVHFVGCERGVHFYAMQLIEGRTLAELIRGLRQPGGPEAPAGSLAGELASGRWAPPRGTRVPAPSVEASTQRAALATERSASSPAFFRTAAHLGAQAAEALEHAHQQGVIHRDVKPANLLVDAAGRLWVADFGLAWLGADAGLTMTGDLLGTLRYMSPEQALAQRVVVDGRTDVYSLGATLYELLTLEPAFPGRDRQELLRKIAFDEPKPPRRLNPAIPPDLETVVLKALAKEPEGRYATAQELADDLKRFLKDEPVRARRPTPWQRLRRWARRHRPVVASVVAGGVALLLTVAVTATVAAVRIAGEQKRTAAALEGHRRLSAELYLDKGQLEGSGAMTARPCS